MLRYTASALFVLLFGCDATIGEAPILRVGTFSSPAGSFQAPYTESEHGYLVGGDMLYSRNSPLNGAATVAGVRVWPGGRIPYQNDAGSADFEAAVRIWNARSGGTSIELVPRTDEADYLVVLDDGASCASFVGMQGGLPQPIFVSSNCSLGDAVHEIGHAAGLVHEHQRGDRDEHIEIHWDNIVGGTTGEAAQGFLMKDPSFVPVSPYDIDSIMHYPNYSQTWWTIDPSQPSFSLRDDPSRLAPYDEPSFGDINALSFLYQDAPSGESTEPAPTPTPDTLQCLDGSPFAASEACDGVKDCMDGSDESQC